MMEYRLFVVIREVDDGLTLTFTNIDPPFPAEGVVAAFRVPGAVDRIGTVLHIAGASVLPPA